MYLVHETYYSNSDLNEIMEKNALFLRLIQEKNAQMRSRMRKSRLAQHENDV